VRAQCAERLSAATLSVKVGDAMELLQRASNRPDRVFTLPTPICSFGGRVMHDKIRGVRKIDPIAISFQMREFL